MQDQWTAVDRYITSFLPHDDAALFGAMASSTAAGLPPIAVSPTQGKFLHLLARMIGAKKILEIGTLGGYSTIWLGRALPSDGRLITLEYDAKHALIAGENIARAGLAKQVEVRLGNALETLAKLEMEGLGPFDLIFIDADKPATADYFRWAMKLSRPGSLILVDNVVRKGKVVDAKSDDADVQGIRRFNEALAAEKRVTATEIQTVGSKGYDGIAVALVNAE